MVVPLYEDPCITCRFAADRLIPRFHLEGLVKLVASGLSIFTVMSCCPGGRKLCIKLLVCGR